MAISPPSGSRMVTVTDGRGRPTEPRRARKGGRKDRRQAGDVVRRDADDRRFLLVGAGEFHGREDVGRQIAMAQDRGLWLASGAAGVEQDGDVVGVPAVWVRQGSAGVG